MAKDKYYGKTLRKNFARHEEVMPMPNLLEIQKTSYREFLDTGLREVFNDVGAITDYQGNLELTFIDFRMDERQAPCRRRYFSTMPRLSRAQQRSAATEAQSTLPL